MFPNLKTMLILLPVLTTQLTIMQPSLLKPALFLTLFFCPLLLLAQVDINGSIKNTDNEPLSGVSVTVKGSGSGTVTDEKGNFKLTTSTKPPLTLIISSIGYALQEVRVKTAAETVQVSLVTSNSLGQEVVISATRTPSRILESPVTIERVSLATIRNSSAATYYDIVGNLKGVDVVTASLTFKTPSTRGFNKSGNTRLNQIVDGMDNQAPGLNFSLGSVIGLNELDVESMELLPGASSALYGPGGMNGSLIINSKSPFKYPGLSFQVKTGLMHTDGRTRGRSNYYNAALRWAQKIGKKFAFKIGGEFIHAKDWVADDYRNYKRLATTGNVIPGTRETDPNYEGVNVYGDETSIDIKTRVLNPLAAAVPFYAPYINALPATINVSRTGYTENEVVNPNTVNIKLSGALDYKITSSLDFIVSGFWGTGNTVYTGSDRYSLKDLKMGQYKVELNNGNWFLRAFTTQENAGQSFNTTVTTRLFNEAWKPSGGQTGWYSQYSQAFLQSKLSGLSDAAAHNAARAFADIGRPAAGSSEFRQLFDKVRSIPIVKGGGLFVDKTNLYNVEGQYNIASQSKGFADIIIGGNFKKYVLNSEGTLFADSAGTIGIDEYGGYLQATRSLLNDKLRLILSGRYDKNQNFDGKFTPRISAVIKVAEDNNIRLSYQNAYRFASTQQQWINLRVGTGVRLLGGVKQLQDYYHFDTNPVYEIDANMFAGSPVRRIFPKFKAETVNSFEAGYKGLVADKKLLIDVYGYYGIYKNFIARVNVAQSVNGNKSVFTNPATVQKNLSNPDSVNLYSVPTNITSDVKTYGFGIGLDYSLPSNFVVGVNASSDILSNVPPGYVASFNAPELRIGATVNNNGFGHDKRAIMSLAYRWQKSVEYEEDFGNGLLPAFHTLDAQVGYKFPAQKFVVKVGANNLLNQYYRNAFGNASIGGLYYVSFGYNLY